MLGRTQDARKEAWKTVDGMKKEGCSNEGIKKGWERKKYKFTFYPFTNG